MLHEWITSDDASKVAHIAALKTMRKLGAHAHMIGLDELESEALVILMECAQTPLAEESDGLCAYQNCRRSLENNRKGAKFCSRQCKASHNRHTKSGKAEKVPAKTLGHFGSMHTWPEDNMLAYAVNEVYFALNNYCRKQQHTIELSSSDYLTNHEVAQDREPSAWEILVDFFTGRGLRLSGDETMEDLQEAAKWILSA